MVCTPHTANSTPPIYTGSLDGRCCGALITAIAHTLQNSQQEEEGGCVVKVGTPPRGHVQ